MSFTFTQSSPTNNIKKWDTTWANKIPTQKTTSIAPIFVNPLEEGTSSAFGETSVGNISKINENKEEINNKKIFSFSDYKNSMEQKEKNKLIDLNKKTNEYLLKESNNKNFFNLSLNDIVNNTVITVLSIFNDLLELMKKEEYNINKMSLQDMIKIYTNIFIKEDRMIYFGVFLIFLSLLFMVFFLSF